MSETPTMTPAQIAEALQVDERTFLARRPRLQRDYAFPRALPGCMLRWSRAQVLAWINRSTSETEPPEPLRVVAGNDVIARLEEKYVREQRR
ncbi:MAG TPA: hypothetical protein VKU03_12425 [Roseiarcus sp.]|nr:hypothetical protein [Roseiarcus sp.]